LFIKEQWDQQRAEERMIKKRRAHAWKYKHELAYLPINNTMGDQSHAYSLVVCLGNVPLILLA